MSEPMNDATLDEIRRRNDYLSGIPFDTHGPDATHGDGCPPCGMVRSIGDVTALLGEVERMRDELAEERAGHNPLLRCLLIKAAPDRDLYVGWSNSVEAPTGIWTRAEALAYGFPRSRLDRADKNGSAAIAYKDGHWDDTGFIAEQRGWLRRDRLGDYAQAYAREDYNAAWDLLEPFEGETEVRRD
jgi:hypothetical protein